MGKVSPNIRLDNKTAVITGSNNGIGKVTAADFYKRGCRVIMACRNVEKANEAKEDIEKAASGNANVGTLIVKKMDLSSLKSVRECAEEIMQEEEHIHLLLNNAGVMMCPKQTTEDGFDMQFGTNHLGHFLFTLLLLPKILKSAPARVINVSSGAHVVGKLNFKDLNSEKKYSPTGAYAQSKMANILFAKELARRLEGVMMCPKQTTEDGFDMQFGTNHLGHFLLTLLLLPKLLKSTPARIVNVSSGAHMMGKLKFEDLNSEKNYSPTNAYAQSKMANILFAKELARRLEGTGVTTYSLHPGIVKTELGRHIDETGGFWWWLFRKFEPLIVIEVEEGAKTSIYCALDEKIAKDSGKYYADCKEKAPNCNAEDMNAAKKLWNESVKMVKLGDYDPFASIQKS